jgi:hypothetical protein
MEKIPQPHGGALLPGGVKGNRGGGTIAYRIRRACAEGVEAAIPNLIEIATGKADGVTPGEQTQAWDKLAKYGIGPLKAVMVEDAEVATLAVNLVNEMFRPTPEQLTAFADRLTTEIYNLGDVENGADD